MTKLKIHTLQNISVPAITNVFNRAFSDYMLPVQMTESAMKRKIRGEQIDLSLSPGCFIDNELCGFILHGTGQREGRQIVWNGGTGVIPGQRGQGITSRLYEFIIPELDRRDYAETVLEVIDTNQPAIHIYQQNGFETTRVLLCYRGDVSACKLPHDIDMRATNEIDWDRIRNFWSWQPSFQNAEHKLVQLRDDIQIVSAYENDQQVGYIAFAKSLDQGDVYQFAVDKVSRGNGIGHALFATAVDGKTVPLKVANVDAGHDQSNLFLEKIGLQKIVRQIEMTRKF